jgi:hypothetical protein
MAVERLVEEVALLFSSQTLTLRTMLHVLLVTEMRDTSRLWGELERLGAKVPVSVSGFGIDVVLHVYSNTLPSLSMSLSHAGRSGEHPSLPPDSSVVHSPSI